MATPRESSLVADVPGLDVEPPRDLSRLRALMTTRGYDRMASGGLFAAVAAALLSGFLLVRGGQWTVFAAFPGVVILLGIAFFLYGRVNHRDLLKLLETGTACHGTVAHLDWSSGRSSYKAGPYRGHGGALAVALFMTVVYLDVDGTELHFTTSVQSHRHLAIGMDVVVLMHPHKAKIVGAVAPGERRGAFGIYLAPGLPHVGHPRSGSRARILSFT